jgi:hypothetical protein
MESEERTRLLGATNHTSRTTSAVGTEGNPFIELGQVFIHHRIEIPTTIYQHPGADVSEVHAHEARPTMPESRQHSEVPPVRETTGSQGSLHHIVPASPSPTSSVTSLQTSSHASREPVPELHSEPSSVAAPETARETESGFLISDDGSVRWTKAVLDRRLWENRISETEARRLGLVISPLPEQSENPLWVPEPRSPVLGATGEVSFLWTHHSDQLEPREVMCVVLEEHEPPLVFGKRFIYTRPDATVSEATGQTRRS